MIALLIICFSIVTAKLADKMDAEVMSRDWLAIVVPVSIISSFAIQGLL